jgi:hypothetical protein
MRRLLRTLAAPRKSALEMAAITHPQPAARRAGREIRLPLGAAREPERKRRRRGRGGDEAGA